MLRVVTHMGIEDFPVWLLGAPFGAGQLIGFAFLLSGFVLPPLPADMRLRWQNGAGVLRRSVICELIVVPRSGREH